MIIERQIKPQPKHFVGQTQPNRQKRAVRFSFFVCFLQSNQQNVYSVCTPVQQPVRNDRRTTETRQEHKPRHLTERRIYIIPSSIYQLSATAVGSPTPTVGYHLFPRVTVWVTMPGYRRLPPGLPNLPDLPKIAPLGLPGIPSPSDRSV